MNSELIMVHDDELNADPTILEITRLIKEFKENFSGKTSDSEKFLTINELENLWTELKNNTDVLYSDMVRQLMSTVDERDMVRKKKLNMLPKA
jgi:hypothetical protein